MTKYILVLVGIISSALAQIMLKKTSEFGFFKEGGFFVYFISGGIFYVVSFAVYTYALKIFNLSKISPVMTIATMILVVAGGILFFKESLNSRQILGILLGIVSVILIMK